MASSLSQIDLAIETYERILKISPGHKEALDSIFFLRGKPKDAPLRDDLQINSQGQIVDKSWETADKLQFTLDDDKVKERPDEEERKGDQRKLDGDKGKGKKKKKKRKRESSSESSSSR